MKNKSLLLSLIFLLVLPVTAFGATLKYWYVDTDNIGYLKNRNIWSHNIDGFSESDFLSYYNHARSQWRDGGISTYGADEKSTSAIHWYGGKVDTLEQLEPALRNYAAITIISKEFVGTHIYNGQNKNNYIINQAKIYTPKKTFYTSNGYKTMFAHELGHAIGWLGHSTSKNDLMWASAKATTLTTRDINHIKQNY